MDTEEVCSVILSHSLDIVKQLSTEIGPDPLQLDHEKFHHIDRADDILPLSLPIHLGQENELEQEQNSRLKSTEDSKIAGDDEDVSKTCEGSKKYFMDNFNECNQTSAQAGTTASLATVDLQVPTDLNPTVSLEIQLPSHLSEIIPKRTFDLEHMIKVSDEKQVLSSSKDMLDTKKDNEFLPTTHTYVLKENSENNTPALASKISSSIDSEIMDPEDKTLAIQPDISDLTPKIVNDEKMMEISLLEKKVDQSRDLISQSLLQDFQCVKNIFEEIMDRQVVLLKEISENAETMKSKLRTSICATQSLKSHSTLMELLKICFDSGHWLEKSVKPKRLEEVKGLMKDYVSLRYGGIVKIDSIVNQLSNNILYPPIHTAAQVDSLEPVSKCDPFLVTVTHVNDPGEFYVVRLRDVEQRSAIFYTLKEAASTYPFPQEIIPGHMYAVSNNSQNWSRGYCGKECGTVVVGDLPPETLYEFFLLDQGHYERIKSSCIRVLPIELVSVPPLARECTLNQNFQRIPWDAKSIASFKQMVRRSPMNMRVFAQEGGVLNVDLAQLPCFGEESNIVSVRDALLFSYRPVASPCPLQKKFVPKKVVECFEKIDDDPFKQLSVKITYATTPGIIYVNILDDEFSKFELMSQEMQTIMNGSNESNPESFQRGGCYAAKYKESWFRVMVEEKLSNDRVHIFYIDTGHRLTCLTSNCATLPDRFMEIPAQAVRCALSHVYPPVCGSRLTKIRSHHSWPHQVTTLLSGYVGKTGVIFIDHITGNDVGRVGRELVVQVVLYVNNEQRSLNTCLVNLGLGKSKKKIIDLPEHQSARLILASKQEKSQSSLVLLDPKEDESTSSTNTCSYQADFVSDTPTSLSLNVSQETITPFPLHFMNPGQDSNLTVSNPVEKTLDSLSATLSDGMLAIGLSNEEQEISQTTEPFNSNNSCVGEGDSRRCTDDHSQNVEVLLGCRSSTGSSEKLSGNSQFIPEELPVSKYLLSGLQGSNEDIKPTDESKDSSATFHYCKPMDTVNSRKQKLHGSRSIDVCTNTLPSDSKSVHVDSNLNQSQSGNSKKSSNSKARLGPNLDRDSNTEIVAVRGTQPKAEVSMKVFFSWIDSPEAIYFRNEEMQQKLRQLQYQMQGHYKAVTQRPIRMNFDVGFRCAVYVDTKWFRAEVTCMDSYPECGVVLSDFGYHRVVSSSDIYPLAPDFDSIPRLILQCSLHGVYANFPGTWNEDVNKYITEKLLGAEDVHLFRRGSKESKYASFPSTIIYTYFSEGDPLQLPGRVQHNLNEELIEEGLVSKVPNRNTRPRFLLTPRSWKSIELPRVGSVFWGIVTWVSRESEIYLHNVKSTSTLNEIKKWLNEAYSNSEPTEADLHCRPDDLCIAKYALDGDWHRAIVRQIISSEKVEVFFVDYGTLDSVDCRDIRLNIMLQDLPTQAIRCVLHNIQPPKADRSEGLKVLKESTLTRLHCMIVEQEFQVKVEGRGPPIEVSLTVNRKSVAKMLVEEKLAEFIVAKKTKKHHKKKRTRSD